MATKTLSYLTLLEAAKQVDPNGNAAKIAEILNEVNELWGVLSMRKSNDANSDVVTVRTSLPTITTRQVNKGGSYGVSGRKQIREDIILLEEWVRIDEIVLDRQNDPKMHRHNEIVAQLEAMDQEFIERLFYDSPGDAADGLTGLANRFNLTSMANVHGAGGTGDDTTSVYMMEPGYNKFSIIFPGGSEGGVKHEDKGKRTVYDSSGNPYDAYEDKLQLQFGITVPDARCVQRIANIEDDGSSYTLFDTTNLVHHKLIDAKRGLRSGGKGAVMVVNRTTAAQADKLAWDKGSNAFGVAEWDGMPVTTWQGMRLVMVEGILDTETAIS